MAAQSNKFDQGLEQFVSEYRYELIASFTLIALLGGIVFAAKLFSRSQEVVEVIQTTPVEQQVGEQEKILIDVSGAVNKPGVYKLNAQSRVKDALDKAQGLNKKADKDWVGQNINLAEPLRDGQKIYIPARSEDIQKNSPSSVDSQVLKASDKTNRKISLNRASKEELMRLNGVGPNYAQKIIQARPFSSKEELLNISGIGPKTYAQIKDSVTVY